MMAAATAAKYGAQVVLIEKNERLGAKMLITGGGRCNITNTADYRAMVDKVLRNPRFLYGALRGFDSQHLRNFLAHVGLDTKVEEAGRVFPVSNSAVDAMEALAAHLRQLKVNIRLNCNVKDIVPRGTSGFAINLSNDGKITADAVVIATGGLSVPRTGCTGDGHRFAKALGHKVTKLHPAIVPLVAEDGWISGLMGLGLPDVGLRAVLDGKEIYRGRGDVMFTHFGLSGPVVLEASSYLADKLHLGPQFYLDLAPNLPENDLNLQILHIFGQNLNKNLSNILGSLLPERMIPAVLEISGIGTDAKARDTTKTQRKNLCRNIKALGVKITGSAGFGTAMVTCGGVAAAEIEPSTMESKLVPGLYFAGEVLDVDALTGGYNLQIAFSTGHLAGRMATGGWDDD